MRTLLEIANDVRNRISGKFPVVRFSTASETGQQLREIEAVSINKLPAIIISIHEAAYTQNNRVREPKLSLVLVDRFVAGSDQRAESAWTACETLAACFPAEGTILNDVVYLPERLVFSAPDEQYISFTLHLRLQQRT